MTSIALSPRSRASAGLRFGPSIRFPRRRNHAVAVGASARQFSLQPLRLIFQTHPAQFANALDEIIRSTLVFRSIVALWLLERHWHCCPPAIFCCWLCRLSATRSLHRSWAAESIARRYTAANLAGRQNLSFDLLGYLRKGIAVRRNILRQKIV
jgi:hypothetical protein